MNTKLWLLPALLALAGCAGTGTRSGPQSWRCEHGIDFRVRFVDDSALIEGARANEILFRDAGGQGPQQSVYRNATMRAEFGLGANGREALLTYPALPLKARCVRD